MRSRWLRTPPLVGGRSLGLLAALLLSAPVAAAEEPPTAVEPAPPSAEAPAEQGDSLVGTWHLLTTMGSRAMRSQLHMERSDDGALRGQYLDSRGGEAAVTDLRFADDTLSFARSAGARQLRFEARIEADMLRGNHKAGPNLIPVVGSRDEAVIEQLLAKHNKAMERGDDLEADYQRHKRRALPRDGFPVLFDPTLRTIEQAAADQATGLLDDDLVLGIAEGKEAKAYPIAIMGIHELVNDTINERPIAASW